MDKGNKIEHIMCIENRISTGYRFLVIFYRINSSTRASIAIQT